MGGGKSPAGMGGGKVKAMKNVPFAFQRDEMWSKPKEKAEWKKFEESFGEAVTVNQQHLLDGYVGTAESWDINQKLYDPKNTKKLTPHEQDVVKNLDDLIDSHSMPHDGKVARYVDEGAVVAMLGLNKAQAKTFLNAVGNAKIHGDKSEWIANLNKIVTGSTTHSESFTSSSATQKHLFSNRPFRREISVPKGTKAFATNPSEHEIIFGRKMNTVVTGISLDGNKVVIHERFVSYGDK